MYCLYFVPPLPESYAKSFPPHEEVSNILCHTFTLGTANDFMYILSKTCKCSLFKQGKTKYNSISKRKKGNARASPHPPPSTLPPSHPPPPPSHCEIMTEKQVYKSQCRKTKQIIKDPSRKRFGLLKKQTVWYSVLTFKTESNTFEKPAGATCQLSQPEGNT